MNLKELSYEEQVEYLRQIMKSNGSPLLGNLALCVFRQHLISRHLSGIPLKPALRWYLGQLAKLYIRRNFNEAKASLNNFADIGLLEVEPGQAPTKKQDYIEKEYRLDDALFPALKYALEEAFGREFISKVVQSVKFYRPTCKKDDQKENNLEVKEWKKRKE
jgi:hypothetical protein